MRGMAPTSLAAFPRLQPGTVGRIEWERLQPPEARRLRELGFDEGADIEVLHRSGFGSGPVACAFAVRPAEDAARHGVVDGLGGPHPGFGGQAAPSQQPL